MRARYSWGEKGRSLHFFLKNESRYSTTMKIMRTVQENDGIRFSALKDMVGLHWIYFIREVLMPEGYLTVKKNGLVARYYVTPKGYEFMLELENKYKEEKMKHLYGHVL